MKFGEHSHPASLAQKGLLLCLAADRQQLGSECRGQQRNCFVPYPFRDNEGISTILADIVETTTKLGLTGAKEEAEREQNFYKTNFCASGNTAEVTSADLVELQQDVDVISNYRYGNPRATPPQPGPPIFLLLATAGSTVVTACSERIDFHTPVRPGELVELVAQVIAVGKTSMTVEVELFAEQLVSGKRQLCTWGRFVLVALDQRGRPNAVPKLPSPGIQGQGS